MYLDSKMIDDLLKHAVLVIEYDGSPFYGWAKQPK